MNLEEEVLELKKEISSIKSRNKRVETDKAWETSIVRKVGIGILTYFVMIVFMYSLKVESPLSSALIPTLGYLLSTFSLSKLKSWWINKKLHI